MNYRIFVKALLFAMFFCVQRDSGFTQERRMLGNKEFQKFGGEWFSSYQGQLYRVNMKSIVLKLRSWVTIQDLLATFSAFGIAGVRDNGLGLHYLTLEEGKDPLDVVEQYRRSGLVDLASPSGYGRYLARPNDAHYLSQWHLQRIQMEKAWDIITGGPSVIVAIIDSGTEWDHEDIGPTANEPYENVWKNSGEEAWGNQFDPCSGNHVDNDVNGFTCGGYLLNRPPCERPENQQNAFAHNYVDDWKGWDYNGDCGGENNDSRGLGNGHGTQVAGIVGAKTNNGAGPIGIGVAGVAGGWAGSGVRMMILSVGEFNADALDVEAAIRYAALKGASVIQLSLGFDEELGQPIKNALDFAMNPPYRCFVACAAGNSGGAVSFPAKYISAAGSVVAVGATTNTPGEQKWALSNWDLGYTLDIAAPGVNIFTTLRGNGYGLASENQGTGTSFAAPQVSALAALLKFVNPSLTNVQIETRIKSTADKVGGYQYNNEGRSPELGHGRINAHRAIKAAIANRRSPGNLPLGYTLGAGYFIFDNPSWPATAQFNVTESFTLTSGCVLVLDRNVRVIAEAGETITCMPGSRVVYDEGSELMCNTGGTILVDGAEVIFQGTGSCMATAGGLLKFGSNIVCRVNRGGLIASTQPGTVELEAGAKLIIEGDGILRWNASSTWVFGTNSSVEVYGTVEVADGVTLSLPPGSNFKLHPGAQVKMGTNALIMTDGKFHAIGNAQSQVVFQGTNGTTWEGIRAKSGNFSGILGDIRIEHATFSNATKPIHLETPVAAYIANTTINSPQIGAEILPNYNLWVEPPPPPTMQLVAVTINGAYSYGITVENFSDLQLGSCVVSGNQGIAGIALTGSSPKILESTFSGFDIGIWGVANSAPLLFDQGIGGFNTFTQNIVGAQFGGSSNAALGIDDGTGGQNSFTAYYSYAVALADNSFVNAEWNWWDTQSPDPNVHFSIDGSSKLFWEPYLMQPPGGNNPLAGGVGAKEGDDGGDPRSTPTDPRMKEVLRLRVQNRNVEAAALLRSIVADQGGSAQIKRWSLGHLLAVSQKLRTPNLAAYLSTLQTTMPQLRQYLAELMPSAHIRERSVSNALECYERNIRNHGNSITEAQALYGKFTYALYGEGNRTEAQALLNTLQSRYPRTGQTKLATAQFNATSQSMSRGNGPVAKGGAGVLSNSAQISGTTPSVFALHQNYPNPFNPTTKVRFQIADFGLVTLKVFDVLGREVATLVNDELNAGAHEAVFDASSLASGIYIYKLQAGVQTEVKRMILMK